MEWLGIPLSGWLLIVVAFIAAASTDWLSSAVSRQSLKIEGDDEEEARRRSPLLDTANLISIRVYLSAICWLLFLLIVAVVSR